MAKTETLKITTPTDREIVMTRVFDAPRTLVFEALTRPELLKRWFGAHRDWSLAVCEIDLRVGGSLRYVWRAPNRKDMGMSGVFREIVVPERIVNTEIFDDPWYPGEALSTAVLVEQGGKTTLTTTALYDSKEIRDGVLKSGMEEGVASSYDKLEELLASRLVRDGAQGGA
jgi:uncharacterized protein YndB with AHSA1/START domain